MRFRTLCLALLLAAPLGQAAAGAPVAAAASKVFYVDGKNGHDTASGTTPATAFKTIAKASNALPAGSGAAGWTINVVGYGDYVYRERPVPPGWDRRGGTTTPIVYQAYGYNGTSSGYVKPIVSGADAAPRAGQSWSSEGSGVFSTSWPSAPFDFNQLTGNLQTAVFQDTTTWLWERDSLAELKAKAGEGGYWWASGKLYVAPLGGTSHAFDVVMRNAFYFYGVEGVDNVTVRGFEVRHAANGISFAKGVDNGTATDNKLIGNLLMGVGVSGWQNGPTADAATNAVIQRNEGAYNTLQAVKLDEGTVGASVCDNNFHHNGLQGIKVQGAPGGTGYTGPSSGNLICRNQVHDQFYNPTGSVYNNASGITIANGAQTTSVTDNQVWGNDVGIHVVQESAGKPAMNGTLLDGNRVWSNRRFALNLYDGDKGSGAGTLTARYELYWGNGIGVMADRGTTNKTLDHVTIWDSATEGIKVGVSGSGASLVVKNSLVTGNGGKGVWLVSGNYASLQYTGLHGNAGGNIYGSPSKTAVNAKPPSYLSTAQADAAFLTIGEGSYQYTAGPSGVPIGALWIAGDGFVDIGGSSFAGDIIWLADSGITKGCAPNLFCPNDSVTRGQMAAFLVRALALPDTGTDFFSDDQSSTFEGDINRLAAAGITKGCTATTFCPSGTVSRGQMAAFLVRALALPPTSTDFFSDDQGSTFEGDINRLAASGITKGCSPTTFCPDDTVTRGQMAAFLHRAFG